MCAKLCNTFELARKCAQRTPMANTASHTQLLTTCAAHLRTAHASSSVDRSLLTIHSESLNVLSDKDTIRDVVHTLSIHKAVSAMLHHCAENLLRCVFVNGHAMERVTVDEISDILHEKCRHVDLDLDGDAASKHTFASSLVRLMTLVSGTHRYKVMVVANAACHDVYVRKSVRRFRGLRTMLGLMSGERGMLPGASFRLAFQILDAIPRMVYGDVDVVHSLMWSGWNGMEEVVRSFVVDDKHLSHLVWQCTSRVIEMWNNIPFCASLITRSPFMCFFTSETFQSCIASVVGGRRCSLEELHGLMVHPKLREHVRAVNEVVLRRYFELCMQDLQERGSHDSSVDGTVVTSVEWLAEVLPNWKTSPNGDLYILCARDFCTI